MALTPETADALKQALEAVIQECGDTPGYEDLVAKLQDAEQAIPDVSGEGADHGGEHGADNGDDAQSADDMFAHAEQAHKERRKAKGDDHENPFAKDAK